MASLQPRPYLAGILVIAALSACAGQDDEIAGPQGAREPRDGRLTASPGGVAAGQRACAPGKHTLKLGDGRTALMRVTAGAQGGKKALMLVLHGAGSGGGGGGLYAFRGGWDARGLVMVAPSAEGSTWSLLSGRDTDLPFVNRALSRVLARCRIDARRVAVGGFSDGATYALTLGLANGDLFRAVIALSPGGVLARNRVGKPRIFIAHGTLDNVLPISQTSDVIVRDLRDDGYSVTYRKFRGGHEPPRTSRARRCGGSCAVRRSAKRRTIGCVESLLLEWFEAFGRDLPWRRTRDPYAILVSEVMLQQTQVERVLPRYVAWLHRWPTVESLAAAPAADAIREWQGLGYNRRALNLHRAAQRIALEGWPSDLATLPGVGAYTAAAIRCFAFGEAVLPVDVNVERVLRRTGASFSATFAEAVMDLGATICLARVPRCERCPLSGKCPSRGIREDPAPPKQGPFEGSFRQRRAAVLRRVAESARHVETLDAEAVRSLERDGLVVVEARMVALPS